MGSTVSAGCDNDELTDNLCDADYIRTEKIEKLFRAVDRGEYILPEYRMNAYKDQAWRSNHLHLSAPCIYSEVLEGLGVTPGMSFLNLGSGTGYLSTLVGLILGHTGINHGVEYYDDVIQYANKKLEDFKRYSGAMDEFDFCEPKFMQGNCLCLTTERRYDRVYVGAACPIPFDRYLQSFVKIGGILVMPFHDQLLQVRRTSETSWVASPLLPVSFATLIMPKDDCKDTIELLEMQPDSLQLLCRTNIRNLLRSNVLSENPALGRPIERQKKSPRKAKAAPRHVCRDMEEFFFRCSALDEDMPRGFVPATDQDNPDISNSSMAMESSHEDDSHDEDQCEGPQAIELARVLRDASCQSTSTVSDQVDEDMELAYPSLDVQIIRSNQATTANAEPAQKTDHQRRKFDLGIGDEDSNDEEPINEPTGQGQSKRTKLTFLKLLSARPDRPTDTESTDSNDTVCLEESSPRSASPFLQENDDDVEEFSDSDEEDDAVDTEDMEFYHKRRTVDSPFTEHMCKKINELPLPPTLKSFLNYYRF